MNVNIIYVYTVHGMVLVPTLRMHETLCETDLLVESVDSELSCVVCAAQGGHVAAYHAGVCLAIILTVPLPILLHNLHRHSEG